MTLNRRNLLQLSAAGAVAAAAGGRFAWAATDAERAIAENAAAYFAGLGYKSVPPLDLITGDAFNGGLRFDESDSVSSDGPTIRLQTAARVEDIPERDRAGVLATFDIIGLSHPEPEDDTILPAVLRFLIDERGLDPAKMLMVSTEEFRPHLDDLDGFDASRFLERPFAEARTMGDGSGYFAPSGHPAGPAIASVGLYYPVPGTEPDGDPIYPPPDHIEIAEIGIARDAAGHTAAGLGLQRLAMAEGNPVPDFDETRLNLLRLLEDESERTGKPLPDGYTQFASL